MKSVVKMNRHCGAISGARRASSDIVQVRDDAGIIMVMMIIMYIVMDQVMKAG